MRMKELARVKESRRRRKGEICFRSNHKVGKAHSIRSHPNSDTKEGEFSQWLRGKGFPKSNTITKETRAASNRDTAWSKGGRRGACNRRYTS